MIEIACLCILIVCIACQEIGSDGFYVGHVLMWVLVINIGVSETEIGHALESEHFYMMQTVYSILIITLLSFRFSRVSILLMILYTASIFTQMLGWWMELYDVYGFYFYATILLFGVQIALLMSERITNGCYRYLEGVSVFRIRSDVSDKAVKHIQE